MLRDLMVQGKANMEVGPSTSASSTAVPAQPEDPDERWWTPLPSKTISRHSSPKRTMVVVEEEPRNIEDVIMEFDKVINWCSNTTKTRNSSGSASHSEGRQTEFQSSP